MQSMETAPGVIAVPTRLYVEIKDVMTIFGCKKSKAGNYIRDINAEAMKQGKVVPPAGKVNKYLFSKLTEIPIEDINAVLRANDRKE